MAKTYKKEVTVGLWQVFDRFDPMQETGTAVETVYECVYNTLISYNWDTRQPEPELAESWVVESTSSYVFNLRKGVKFSNGEEMTADDIVFSYVDRPADVQGAPGVAVWGVIDEIEVINDYCVRFKLNKPDGDFLLRLYLPYYGVMNRDACEADPVNGHLIATGGWAYDSFSPNESITLKRFDDSWYWKEFGETPTEKLIFRFIEENTTRSIALQNAEIAASTQVNTADIPILQEDKNINTFLYAGESLSYGVFNMQPSGKLSGDARLRKAIAYALKYDELNMIQSDGRAERALSYWGKSQFGLFTDFDEQYEYNLEKAKQLMAEAGYPNGGLEITLVVRSNESKMAPLIQAHLKDIGIKVNISSTDSAGISEVIKTGEFDMMLYGISLQPIGDRFAFVANVNHNTNRAKYDNQEMMTKFAEALGETDDAKRIEIYKEIQIELHEDLPYLPLFYGAGAVASYKGVSGITWCPSGKHDFTHIMWEE